MAGEPAHEARVQERQLPLTAAPKPDWSAAAWLAVLPILLRPLSDPDLWWHLSAGRWMAENLAVPRADWLSHTMAGRPWVDFEWLSQLSFYAAYRLAGLPGLLLLKAGLLAAAAAAVHALLKRAALGPLWSALGMAAWCMAVAVRADLRTELFSLLGFALLLGRLEEDRVSPLPCAAFFCLWANLHGGFVCGLALLGIHAAAGRGRRRNLLLCLGAGAAGALLNPYGWKVYGVIFAHAREGAALRALIQEWKALPWWEPGYWPTTVLLLGSPLLFFSARTATAKRPTPAAALAAAAFAAGTLSHSRMAAYFAAAAIPLCLHSAAAAGFLERAERGLPLRSLRALGPWASAALCALLIFPPLWWGHRRDALRPVWTGPFPVRAASFLAGRPELSQRSLYNPWEWGGYLGFRLGPELRVFQDGRHLFFPLLKEASGCSADGWEALFDRHGVDLALLKRPPRQKLDPRRWEQVYSDDQAELWSRR